MGGDFRSGALAGGFGKAATLGFDGVFTDAFAEGTAVAIVGGVAAEIGGGKFANGALTAAYGYLFNRCGQKDCFGKKVSVGYQAGTKLGSAGHLRLSAFVNAGSVERDLSDGTQISKEGLSLTLDIGKTQYGINIHREGATLNDVRRADFSADPFMKPVDANNDVIIEFGGAFIFGYDLNFNVSEFLRSF